MKTSIEIANRTKKEISADFVKGIIRKTVKLSESKISDFSVSVVFLGKDEIRKINRKYRKKNKSTDILSFSYSLGYNKEGKAFAGELALCPEIIARHAKENKVAFQKELAFVLSHGVLHLLDFRHGREMYKIQDEVCESLRITNHLRIYE